MRQTRQKTPLALEAILPGAANERDVEEFDRGTPLEPAVAAPRQPN